jgi:nucleoside-diphosphate-sugar epimerase
LNHVMVTGCAGPIGARVLRTVCEHAGSERVYLLGDRPAEPPPAGVELCPVEGDPSQPHLGLGADDFEALCGQLGTIFHCAERMVLDRDLEAARASNVRPVSTLIEVLERNPEARLAHVSTTMVAGNKRGLFTEFDLACGQQFHNAYEQSKFEAEGLLRASAVQKRVIVFRPSLTAGAPTTAHGPLGALLAGLGRRFVLLAGDPRMHLDTVPLSYVARSMVALARQPEALGQTVHLVAGLANTRPLAELVAAIRQRLSRGRVGFLPPAFGLLVRIIGLLGVVEAFPGRWSALAPYFRHRSAFDDFCARSLLEPLGIHRPSFEDHLAELLGEAKPS